jgi:hypothetical protein
MTMGQRNHISLNGVNETHAIIFYIFLTTGIKFGIRIVYKNLFNDCVSRNSSQSRPYFSESDNGVTSLRSTLVLDLNEIQCKRYARNAAQ